jgi:hypothetical protein
MEFNLLPVEVGEESGPFERGLIPFGCFLERFIKR